MKIIIATSSYPLHPDDSAAAAGLFVRDLALQLNGQGHAIRVITQDRPGSIEDDPGIEVIRFANRTDQPLSTLRPTNPRDVRAILSILYSGTKELAALVAKDRPNLIIAMWAVPAGLMARFVSLRHRVPSDIWNYGRNPFTSWLVRLALRGAERIYADGLELSEETSMLSGKPCEFLPSCRRLPAPGNKPKQLNDSRHNFAFVGRFHHNKGVDLLVQAVSRLSPEQIKNSHFYLFGKGPAEAACRNLISDHALQKTVSLMGYANREQIATYLTHCQALIIPSRIESIPVVLSDAAQADCPVVACNVGDMGKLLKRFGNGIVVQPEPDSICEGLTQIWDAARSDFQPGCRRMAAEFSLTRSADKIVE
ncbi:MAG: glycosyltransferase [Deltaproteobacteria bacterium]|nr:glycosyltransferase [Deltaproteobacteria bacterium]